MSQGNDKQNIKSISGDVPSVEVKPHPPEILELDEETIAIAKAKLAGVNFENIYGDEDRSILELFIRTQARKIRELFQTPNELKFAFSSDQKKQQSKKDMIIDGIDLEFVKDFCQKRQMDFADDAEALIIVGFEDCWSGGSNV